MIRAMSPRTRSSSTTFRPVLDSWAIPMVTLGSPPLTHHLHHHHNRPRQRLCHTPIPDPTRLVDSNQVRGTRPNTGTLYLIFFLNRTCTCGYGPHLIIESKYHIQIKRTTTGVVSIKIYTHVLSPIYLYKAVPLHLQIRARNLHLVNPY